jgi:hypothetical protein
MSGDQERPGLATLVAARELIAAPERWAKGAMARKRVGKSLLLVCDADDAEACCWCSLGAIRHVTDTEDEDLSARELLASETQGMWIADFNDRMGHTSVLAAFDRAIAKATTRSAA